jgi:hypothetical protein
MERQNRQDRIIDFLERALLHEQKPVQCSFSATNEQGVNALWSFSFGNMADNVLAVEQLSGQSIRFLDCEHLANWAAGESFNQISQNFT